MKLFKVWAEFEREIEAKNLDEALKKFANDELNLKFCGQEIKGDKP